MSASWIPGEVTEPEERLAGDLAGDGVVLGGAGFDCAELWDDLGGSALGPRCSVNHERKD